MNVICRTSLLLTAYAVSSEEYHGLFAPALDWLIQCIAHDASVDTFRLMLETYKRMRGASLVCCVSTCWVLYVSRVCVSVSGLTWLFLCRRQCRGIELHHQLL